ncbi:MAG: HAMP domain-containing sensor histidine kinase [Actinomycetota bacterium]
MIALAILIVVAGAAATALVSVATGIPASDAVQLTLLAGVGAVTAGSLGAAGLYLMRRKSISAQSVVVAFASLGAVGVGALLAARAMFISSHDLAALAVVLFAAMTVGLVIAFLLGRRVGTASRTLQTAAQSLADGRNDRFEASTASKELAELGRELESMQTKLDETRERERALDASRRELVSWVSHDLRTPLAGIRGIAEALEDEVVTDPATVSRYYRTLRQETDRLAHLVDDLFELSRISAGTLKLQFTRVSMTDLVSDALAGASAMAEIKGVKLIGSVPDGPLEVEVAVAEVTRILHNLLENAIRHTPSSGKVVLEAGIADGQVVVAVSDSCGGIPSEDIDRVFDLAFSSRSARTPDANRGAGLGLAIARGLVEAHHGEIEVANLDLGCRFTMRLPSTQGAL